MVVKECIPLTIHTFELFLQLNFASYQQLRDWIFARSAGHADSCFENKSLHRLTFSCWAPTGVIVYLTCTNENTHFFYLHLRVNPSKLLGNSEPTALFDPTPESVALLGAQLVFILNEFPIPFHISDLSLFRVDLCKDHLVSSQTDVFEYLRLLRRSAHPFHWEPCFFGDERDEHSFRCRNNRYQVTAYDKLFEISQKGNTYVSSDNSKLFRVEVAIFSPGIHFLCTEGRIPDSDWLTQFLFCGKNGEAVMCYVLKRLIPPGDYFSYPEACRVIQGSFFPQPKKDKLCAFLWDINRSARVDTLTIKAKRNGRKRLQQLFELNVNPILIDPDVQISYLPFIFSNHCI